ncbi:MAG: hypothetical protein ABSG96_05770 [Terracidiphilus sp.]|jgi:hypothetical protein
MIDEVVPQDYFFFGLRLSSSFELPSIPLWPAMDSEGTPDITIRFGEVHASLADPIWSSPFVQIGRDKSALVNVATVARFWLPDRSQIVIQMSPGAELFEVEAFLIGTVAGLVLHQRGLLPLHGSCVVLDGRAISISGTSASGKSAIAASLVRRGARLLGDDLCVLHASINGLTVVAGSMRARLWPDVLDRFEIPPEQRLSTRLEHGKHAAILPAADARAWPLHLLVRIRLNDTVADPMLERVHGLDSLFPPDSLVYQRKIGQLWGNAATEFSGLTALARNASRFSLRRTKVLDHLEQCTDLILKAFREEA